jgi:acetyltransferase-like isoleucine patch superfamily enzyme
MSAPRIHPTALVEADVEIGESTAIWDNVHVRRGARIGRRCIVGEKTYIAGDVRVGDLVKLNANVYVCAGVTIEDGAMVAAHTVFTNDRLPRATDPDVTALLSSDAPDDLPRSRVGRGATIGANCTIGPGLDIGDFAMVGMGSVVTRNVPAHGLVAGNPARLRAIVCLCGEVVHKLAAGASELPAGTWSCTRCGRQTRTPPR